MLLLKFLWDTYFSSATDKVKKESISAPTNAVTTPQTQRLPIGSQTTHSSSFRTAAAEIIAAGRIQKPLSVLAKEKAQLDKRYLVQKASLSEVAAALGCKVSEAQDAYKGNLYKMLSMPGISNEQKITSLKQAIADLQLQKHNQAFEFQVDPEDTPAAFGEKWTKEVLENITIMAQASAIPIPPPRNSNTSFYPDLVISEILVPESLTPDAVTGRIIVWTQAQYQSNTTKNTSEFIREYREYWSAFDMANANGGLGLEVGTTLAGKSISIIGSMTPFYDGQQRDDKSGIYYTTVMEEGVPNDRLI